MATPNEKAPTPKERGGGIVKAVNSGDTLVVFAFTRTKGGSPPEVELTLSSVSAPRLGRRNDQDEPFAWDAREFLRKKAIGQRVNYEVEFKTDGAGEENLALALAREGLVKVRGPAEGKDPRNEGHAALIQAGLAAEEAKKGIFTEDQKTKDLAIRPVYSKPDYVQLFDKLRGSPANAVVEWVREGSVMRVSVNNSHHNVLLRLAGASSPSMPPPRSDDQPEPFAVESKFFTERYLLHRDVIVTFRSIGRNDEFSATVEMMGRDLGEELLRNGLARYVSWSCPVELKEKYSTIESAAKAKKERIWSRYNPAAEQKSVDPNAAPATFQGKVREIQMNNGISVQDVSTGIVYTLYLASLNLPKQGGPNREADDWAYEARELLRSRLVGKRVVCTRDYVKEETQAADGRQIAAKSFWTIVVDKTNVALMLVERGLAKLIAHRGDEDRSSSFDLLNTAERKAQQKKKGIWSPTAAPAHRYNDLTLRSGERAKKAKNMLPFLQRAGRTSAIIEFVFGGSRFKVFVPKEGCMIMLSLEGIRTPMRDDAFADECTEYAKEKLLQRDVEIIVESVDKNGTFMGTLFLRKENFSVTLLEQGLARVFGPAAERAKFGAALLTAQEEAKAARRKIWESYDPEEEKRQREARRADADGTGKKETFKATVSEIVDGSCFYLQNMDAEASLNQLMDELNAAEPAAASPAFADGLHKKAPVLCKFAADNRWYRARVLSKKDGQAQVLYTDFGNCDIVPVKELRPLDTRFQAAAPFARECCLAFTNIPTVEEDFGEDAAYCLRELVWGKTLQATVEAKEGEVSHVSLVDPQQNKLVNAEIVRAGLATVPRRTTGYNAVVIKSLKEAQEEARKGRINMWQYGDIDEDDF